MIPARESVTLHPRKPLTKPQRAAMFLAHNGVCCICRKKITGPDWIDEHISPLWVGGSNDPENRGPAHIPCAAGKTSIETTARAKVKRLIARQDGTRKPRKAIPSRGFDKSKSRKFSGQVVSRV